LHLKKDLNSSRTRHFTLFLYLKKIAEQQQNLPFHPIPCFLQLIITDLDDCCLNCHFTLFPGFFLKKITEQQHKLPFHPIPAFLIITEGSTTCHFTLFLAFFSFDFF